MKHQVTHLLLHLLQILLLLLQVVWTDQWSTLLTFEDRRIIDDERVSVERPFTKDWNLHIRDVQHKDQGLYNCQINTSPVKIKTVHLTVQGHNPYSCRDMSLGGGEIGGSKILPPKKRPPPHMHCGGGGRRGREREGEGERES